MPRWNMRRHTSITVRTSGEIPSGACLSPAAGKQTESRGDLRDHRLPQPGTLQPAVSEGI